MIVLKIENPADMSLPPLIVKSLKELADVEATIGLFLCLPGDEQELTPGVQVIISAVEMTESEYNALPEWSC